MDVTGKPNEIIDREGEWKALTRMWESSRPELAFVLGRRRVGKSFLLSRLAREVGGLYFQAARRTEAEQLADLSGAVGRHFEDPALAGGAVLPSWGALFAYLARQTKDRPFLFVIDEFPYLASASPSLTSVIQHAWDHDWQESRLKLVLCGSFVSAMQQLESRDQPLHGRRTLKLSFPSFACSQAARFVPTWSARDKLVLYGTVGNLPGHLALVDPNRDLRENVAALMLHPGGRLADEAQHILDAFAGDAGVHYSIIDAIANGQRTWKGITGRVGRTGGSLSRPLRWLEDMGIVERVVPITQADRRHVKRAVYRIADPYLRFWHAVVAPLVRAGSVGLTDPGVLWNEVVEARIDGHMGEVFEDVCRQHAVSGALPITPLRVGRWWDAGSRNEIDVVVLGTDDELFVSECKWGSVDRGDLATLRERARLVASELPRAGRVHLGLYSGTGEADADVRAAVDRGEVAFFGPEDLV